jgi:hypothetical protein
VTWSVEADGYFITLPEWVEDSGISDRALRLWCKLSKQASILRGAPLKRTRLELAELMGCSKDTVDRLVKELEGVRALEVDRQYDHETKQYQVNTYRLLTARPVDDPPPVEEPLVRGGRTGAASRSGAARGGRTSPDASSSFTENQNKSAKPWSSGMEGRPQPAEYVPEGPPAADHLADAAARARALRSKLKPPGAGPDDDERVAS